MGILYDSGLLCFSSLLSLVARNQSWRKDLHHGNWRSIKQALVSQTALVKHLPRVCCFAEVILWPGLPGLLGGRRVQFFLQVPMPLHPLPCVCLSLAFLFPLLVNLKDLLRLLCYCLQHWGWRGGEEGIGNCGDFPKCQTYGLCKWQVFAQEVWVKQKTEPWKRKTEAFISLN